LYFSKTTEWIALLGRGLFLPTEFRSFFLHEFWLIVIAVVLVLTAGINISHAENITLNSDQATSTAGYYQLRWEQKNANEGTVYILEEKISGEPDTKTVYRGTDTATVFSGKSDGTYIYSVRSTDNQNISNNVEVVVAHHPLSTAFTFFWLGAIVFVVLLVSIIRGNTLTRKE